MSGMYFLISPAIGDDPGLNWTAITGVITMLGLLTTWFIIYFDKKYQQSLFYLDKSNNYFSKATAILAECENDNVKWHQAINALKEADKLRLLLTDKSHQSIFVTDYLDAAYQIVSIIRNIDDFRFFYGVAGYKGKSASTLYQQSQSPTHSLDRPNYKVSPKELLCLCNFLDKANAAAEYKNNNWVEPKKIFKRDFFRKPLSDSDIFYMNLSDALKITLKVVLDYIKDVEEKDNEVARKCKEKAALLRN